MSRLCEYIESEAIEIIIDKLKEIGYSKKYINECKKIGNLLYRGAFESVHYLKQKIPRTDRTPKLMGKIEKEFYDNFFLKRFGWKPRSEGVFTTGDSRMARSFGSAYYFVPQDDDYKFVWSPKIKDMNLSPHGRKISTQLEILYWKKNTGIEMPEKLQKEIDNFLSSYQDTDLEGAIESKSEVIFKCKSYVLIDFYKPMELLNRL